MTPVFADGRQACQQPGVDPEDFFPTSGHHGRAAAERAKTVCASCPVRDACLAYALPIGALHGIWGGTTAHERLRLRRERRIAPRTLYDDFDPHPRAAMRSAS